MTQLLHQITIQLDRIQSATQRQEFTGQHPFAGADFDQMILGSRGHGLYDPGDDRAVTQKILTEAFTGNVIHGLLARLWARVIA